MPRFRKPDPEKLARQTNPFVSHLVINVRTIHSKALYEKDSEQKLVESEPIFLEQEIVTKTYVNSLHRRKIAALSFKAAHLLKWIEFEIASGSDIITINVKRYILESKGIEFLPEDALLPIQRGSLNTYKSAILELREQGFLAPTTAHETYFINPRYFFKGSRPKKYPASVVRVHNKREADEIDANRIMRDLPVI